MAQAADLKGGGLRYLLLRIRRLSIAKVEVLTEAQSNLGSDFPHARPP